MQLALRSKIEVVRGAHARVGGTGLDPWLRLAILALLVAAAAVVVAAPGLELRTNRYLPFYGLQGESLLQGRADLTLPLGWAHDVFPFLCFLLLRARFDIRSPLAVSLVAFSVWMNTAATLQWLRA